MRPNDHDVHSPQGPERRLLPSYSIPELGAVVLAGAVTTLWAEAASGRFAIRVLVACVAVFLAFYLVGSLVAGWRRLATGVLFDLPLRLLVGYVGVNTALFVLAWVSPLGIVANFGMLLALTLALVVATLPPRGQRPAPPQATPASASDNVMGLLVVGLALAAATLWCQDSLRPVAEQGNVVVFEPWIDGFYHAVHLRIFGASHGWASIDDFRMAGVPARLYHYGVYLTPALVKQVSGMSSYAAFAGTLAPMGVFFTGLGAYALVGSLWGRWPGLTACAALLLLPDGAQQGMRNTFMSYHWLTHISPSATQGLALVAVAWLFVLLGCTRGNRVQLFAGWLVLGIIFLYKLHFFIASALLLLLVPPLFFRGPLGLWRRALWAAAALAVYLAVVVGVQTVPGVPPIRFDGSGSRQVLDLVGSFTPPGALRDFLASRIGTESSLRSNLFFGPPFVLLAALGLFAPLLVILAIRQRRRSPALLVAFPFLLVVNFLAMFLGLALDFRRSTPDELSHRPVMIVYFVVATWVGGAGGLALLEAQRLRRVARPVLLGLVVVLLAVPAFLGAGVQRMWSMRGFSPVRVPVGLVRAAEYMRDHGDPRDVFQDSQFDRTYVVAALSERRTYLAHTMTRMTSNGEWTEEREGAIEHLVRLRDAGAVLALTRQIGVRWFLLHPGDRVDWPDEIVARPAFQLDGYRLYRF